MSTDRFAFGLAVFALVFCSFFAAHGQVVIGNGGGGVFQGAGEQHSAVYALGCQGVHCEPYTAVRKTTLVQKLADGTTVTHETIRKEAHDSSGRTYIESRAGLDEASELDSFNVSDPVNRIDISWNSRSKQAQVTHMPEPTQITPPAQPPQPPPISSAAPPQVSQRPVAPRPEIEKLGTKTINGIEAQGTRMTRIIPAGSEGNDGPITVINETWTSPELKMAVMTINDDPRSGTVTTELTDFERGEPDPALFEVPADYTIHESFPNQPN